MSFILILKFCICGVKNRFDIVLYVVGFDLFLVIVKINCNLYICSVNRTYLLVYR